MHAPALSVMRLARLLLIVPLAQCAIHKYNAERFDAAGDAFVYRAGSEAMFKSRRHPVDADSAFVPPRTGLNDGQSRIKMSDLVFVRPPNARERHAADAGFTGLVEIVIYEHSQEPLIGFVTEEGLRYCCTEEWSMKTKCQVGRLYIAEPERGEAQPAEAGGAVPPWHSEVDFLNDDARSAAIMNDTAVIRKTGVYHMLFVTCSPELSEIVVKGKTVWKNPSGYLPGTMQPLLPFFSSMGLLYAFLGAAWLGVHAFARGAGFAQQHTITAIVAAGMLESCFNYVDLLDFNRTGVRHAAMAVVSAVLGSLKRSGLRLTVLLLARGFGVLRKSGCDRGSLLLAVAHFASSLLCVLRSPLDADDGDLTLPVLLAAPSLLLDVVIAVCVSRALLRTMAKLTAKDHLAKLWLYRAFAAVVASAAAVSVAWLVYEAHLRTTRPLSKQWRSEWMHATYWHMAHFVVSAALCVLWAPGEGSLMQGRHDVDGGEAEEGAVLVSADSLGGGGRGDTKADFRLQRARA